MIARNAGWMRGLGVLMLALAPMAAQAEDVAPTAAAAPAEGKLAVVAKVPIGKWPEGIAINGRTAWIAISGERKISAVNLDTLTVGQDLAAGRLPVQMGSQGDTVYALSHTDKKVWAVKGAPDKAAIKAIHVMPDCPENMVVADGQAWVLLWKGCANSDAQVVRAALNSKAMVVSKPLGKGAWSLAMAHGQLWVMHDDGDVAMLDPRTLQPVGKVTVGNDNMWLASGPQGIYVTGREATLTRIDPQTRAVSGKAQLGARAVAVWADADGLMVLESGGRMSRLDPVTLAVKAHYASPEAGLEGQALVRDGDRWLVTTHTAIGGGDLAGTLWVLKAE